MRPFSSEDVKWTLKLLGIIHAIEPLTPCERFYEYIVRIREEHRCAILGSPTGRMGMGAHLLPHSIRIKTPNLTEPQNGAALTCSIFLRLFCGEQIYTRILERMKHDGPENMLCLSELYYDFLTKGRVTLIPRPETFTFTKDGKLEMFLAQLCIHSPEVTDETDYTFLSPAGEKVPLTYGMDIHISTNKSRRSGITLPFKLSLEVD